MMCSEEHRPLVKQALFQFLLATGWPRDPRQATEPRFFLTEQSWRELVVQVVVSLSVCKGPGALRKGSYCWIHRTTLSSQPQEA